MFRSKTRTPEPKPEPYKPLHNYTVEVKQTTVGFNTYILTIWNAKDERICREVFVGSGYYRENAEQDAHNAVLPFIEKHETCGLVRNFDAVTYQVVAQHVCQPAEVEDEL